MKFSLREIIVIACARLDLALAEILSKRFVKDKKGINNLINLKGDYFNAPISTFSARILLAYLIGLLRKIEFNTLTSLRKLRNYFAHKVKIMLCDNEVQREYLNILHLSNMY